MITEIPNARFWVYRNGTYVKLTLKPGQEVRHAFYRTTDEGWASQTDSWRHGMDRVRNTWRFDGSDCDGRTSTSGAQECPLGELQGRRFIDDGSYDERDRFGGHQIPYPRWQEVGRQRCYDQFAELANY